ncbi:MAG TPA: Uma2 family endonuclease [Acidimicrobiia bacterium]|nr:Uma2 family endonuclease [Acidimicrobiia bacterium]
MSWVFDETDDEARFTGTPHLCIEVLSTDRGADLVRKFARYAAAGLPRYWVIDLDIPEIIVFELGEGGGYREATHLGGFQLATLDVGPGQVTLSPAKLLR